MSKLSRRELLKMATEMAATGALAWVPGRLKGEGAMKAALEAVPEQERVIVLKDEQPWGMYYLDPDSVMLKPPKLIRWDSDGKEIIADG